MHVRRPGTMPDEPSPGEDAGRPSGLS